MTSPSFTENGVVVQTFDEIVSDLSTGLQNIYGYDINLDQNSPDGQRVGIIAKAILDLQTAMLDLYNSFDPDLAEGLYLDKILKIAGLTREPPTKSIWALQVTVNADVVLPSGYSVTDSLGQLWVIANQTAVTVSGNPNSVEFLSDMFGDISGVSGSTITQQTVNLAVTEILATTNSTNGRDEETDAQVRRRRQESLQNPSLGTRRGLQARLLNLDDVVDCLVYENQYDTFDQTISLDAHSLWVVVEGGLQAEIVDVILKNKSAGTGLKGSIVETLPEGDIIKFDRQIDTPLYIHVTATRKDPAVALDLLLIKRELAKKIYFIGESALASKLYEFGYNAGETFTLSDLEISNDDITYTDLGLQTVPAGKFVITTDNIVVTEVI